MKIIFSGEFKLKSLVKLEKDLVKPFINGKDVKKYGNIKPTKFLLFPYIKSNDNITLMDLNLLKEKYPFGFNYIDEFKEDLKNRKIKVSNKDFYKYSAARSLQFYNQQKILVPDMLVKNRISIDLKGNIYHGPAIHSIIFKDFIDNEMQLCILGIFNSKLFWFFIKNTSTALRGNAYRLTPMYLNPFSFPDLSLNNNIISDLLILVTKILDLNKKLSENKSPHQRNFLNQQISSTENEIN